jgi:pimeloyl-ACP methyl ester carboxylesterase
MQSLGLFAASPRSGKNKFAVRGQEQEVYFYPGAGSGPHKKVIFAPGDGGLRGFALTIAENMAASGYDVYGIDTRHYLQSFTGSTILKTSEIAADFHEFAAWAMQGSRDRVLLVGWSEGAGLGLAAASEPQNREVFAGLVVVGPTEFNILAWRWKDIGAEITHSLPNEPTFKSIDFMPKVSPLPLFVISSSNDEYVTPAATQALFAAALEPKRLATIKADDHKYGGATDEFFRTLKEGLTWIQQPR